MERNTRNKYRGSKVLLDSPSSRGEYEQLLVDLGINVLKPLNKWQINRLRNRLSNEKNDLGIIALLSILLRNENKYLEPRFIKLLTFFEVQPGGPYYRNFNDKNRKRLDIVTNVLIHKLLSSYDINLDNLETWLSENNKYIDKNLSHSIDSLMKLNKESTLVKLSYVHAQKYEQIFTSSIDNFKRQAECLDICKSEIVETILKNSFTKEVVLLPYYLRDMNVLELSSENLKNISVTNVWGWLYFAILDLIIDDELVCDNKKLIRDMSLILSCYIFHQFKLCPDIAKVARLLTESIDLNSNVREITEQLLVRRTSVYTFGVSNIFQGINKSIVKDLERYLVIKQYFDDLHDFVDDIKNKRMTILTSKYRKELKNLKKDSLYIFYSNVVCFETINRIKVLYGKISKKMKNFPPLQGIIGGIAEYEIVQELLL